MSSSVSIPEKTLEHWSSQYVSYRYRAQAAVWWPSRGEDINVHWLPTRPGKAVQLELKTTTIAGADLHDVWIDLGQLWEYFQRPLGRQPFYVFPWPGWRGDLAAAASVGGRDVTDLAYSRSGHGWWFANWLVVLTTAQVAYVLRSRLTAHGSPTRGNRARLVRFDLSRSLTAPAITWGSGAAPPKSVRWLDFWSALERCGLPGWPQLIMVPARLARSQRVYTRSDVIGLLRPTADLVAEDGRNHSEFVALTPDADGNYRAAADSADTLVEPSAVEPGDVDDHRQAVFIDASALLPANGSDPDRQ